MMGKKDNAERTQMEIASLEDLVPRNHLVRKLDEAIDMRFIYEEVKDLYSDFGRESIDPVVLIKIAMIQYIFGIPSMRKTIREIEVNFAYRWYLGYGMHEEIPHFSTFGKNYSRRFKDTDLFEKIFSKILSEVAANGFLDTESLFIDGTHIKASANSHKYHNEDSVKVITRHVWEDYMEQVEEIRHTIGMKERYKKRKETIERVFADAKEKHGMRYTQYRGLAKIKMELNLLFGCMNLKKLAIWKWRIKWGAKYRSSSLQFFFSSGVNESKKIPCMWMTFLNITKKVYSYTMRFMNAIVSDAVKEQLPKWCIAEEIRSQGI